MSGTDAAGDSFEDLFEDAPCGLLASDAEDTIVRANRTFSAWTGFAAEDLVGRSLKQLLTPAGRIYYETHYAPLLRMQGAVREIAVELVRADGTRMPALLNATLVIDADGTPRSIRTAVVDARDRRRYEKELLEARRREQEVALELQRALLAGDPPVRDGLSIDVHYRPGTSGLEAGGDWYDAFAIGEGRVAIVVGDVVGRGITAATTMGQLRSAIRALASTGLGPAALLEALDGYAARHSVGRMATLAYAELDLEARTATYAAAGHPFPAAWSDGDPASLLEEGRSPPLDAAARRGPRPEATIRLGRDAGIVLYTDGLIERRNESLSVGLATLRTEIDDLRPEVDADKLARRMQAPKRDDDVCVLVARVS